MGALSSVLCDIVLLEGPWPPTDTQLFGTGPYIVLHNWLVVFSFPDAVRTFKAPSAKSSKVVQTSVNLLCYSWICLESICKPPFKLSTNLHCNLLSMSREVSYSATSCNILDGVMYSAHRNITISADGLVALKLSMLFHNFFSSHSIRQSFPVLAFLHAHCGTHRHTTKKKKLTFRLLFKLVESMIST